MAKVCIEYLTMEPIIIIQPILFQLAGDLASPRELLRSKQLVSILCYNSTIKKR
jgi:hypothetical protein